MKNFIKYTEDIPEQLHKQAKKNNHVRVHEELPAKGDVEPTIILRKGRLGYSERTGFRITTSVSCHGINPDKVVKFYGPRIITARRRRR